MATLKAVRNLRNVVGEGVGGFAIKSQREKEGDF